MSTKPKSKVLEKLEPFYTLVEENDHFRVVCRTQDEQGMLMRDETLMIEKKGCIIYQRFQEDHDARGQVTYSTYGIIGIMNIGNQIFIVIITNREKVASMPSGDSVYLIKGVEFVPFDKNFYQYQQMNQETLKYVNGVKKLLEE